MFFYQLLAFFQAQASKNVKNHFFGETVNSSDMVRKATVNIQHQLTINYHHGSEIFFLITLIFLFFSSIFWIIIMYISKL